jgi:hypothetical protein
MSNWIKPGIPVVNITNLEKVFVVDHAIFKSKEIKDKNGSSIRVSRLIGIKVKHVSNNITETEIMHSKELIPLDVALKGVLESMMFINREGIYKTY